MGFFAMSFGSFLYLFVLIDNQKQGKAKRGLLLPKDFEGFLRYWVCSWTLLVGSLSANICLKIVPISIFAIIYNLKPVLVIFMGFVAGQETFTCKKFSFIFLSFLGTGLIVDFDLFENLFFRSINNESSKQESMAPASLAHGTNLRTSSKMKHCNPKI